MALQHTFFLVSALLFAVLLAFPTTVLCIGVCYGMLGDDLPPPSDVISLYKTNNITAMRLYDPNQDALQALKGSNISLLLDLPNELLQPLASDTDAAIAWIQSNVVAFSDVDFRYIAVGNEVIPGALSEFVLPAMKNIQNALSSAGLQSKIKVSTSVSQAVIGVSYPPSAGAFSSASQPFLGPILQFLASSGSPLLMNVYPYFAYAGDPANIRLDYALFAASTPVVIDVQFNYSNMFDAIVDSVHYAVEKIGGGEEVGIVVSETGWPSAGGTETTIENAQTYASNLIEHVGEGTPKRPGMLETYIFAMFNENQKPEGVEQHWGLFYPQMTPVYPIHFH